MTVVPAGARDSADASDAAGEAFANDCAGTAASAGAAMVDWRQALDAGPLQAVCAIAWLLRSIVSTGAVQRISMLANPGRHSVSGALIVGDCVLRAETLDETRPADIIIAGTPGTKLHSSATAIFPQPVSKSKRD